jgi:hypothetical protein
MAPLEDDRNDEWLRREQQPKLCHCGSGKERELQYDGRGIPLCYTCEDCHDEKMKGYRPEILEYYTQDDVDEPIEEADDTGHYVSGYRVFRDGSYREDFGSDR